MVQRVRTSSEERRRAPDGLETVLLSHLGCLVAVVPSTETISELWKGLLSLPKDGEYWITFFLNEFHRAGLAEKQINPVYLEQFRVLGEYALGEMSEDGAFVWSSYSGVRSSLLGLDALTREMWSAHHAAALESWKELFACWCKSTRSGADLSNFARWAVRPAARFIRMDVVVWLHDVLIEDAVISRSEDALDAIGRFLVDVWDNNQVNLRRNTSTFAAFRGLVNWGADQQTPQMLELIGRIGNLG